MTQTENESAYKNYDARLKDIQGILDQLRKVIGVSEFETEFNQIQDDVNNDPSLAKDIFKGMERETFQQSFEDFSYAPYIKRLDKLNKRLQELRPFYELHVLTTKINTLIAEISCDNIDDIIKSSKSLLDSINTLSMHEHKDKKRLIDEAYEALYSAIKHEELFERSDILTYVLFINSALNRENLGRLLSEDLGSLDAIDLINEDLQALDAEGLGHDFLNYDIVKKISQKTVGEKNSEYQERKRKAIDNITSKVNFFVKMKDNLVSEFNANKAKIRENILYRALNFSRLFSIILVPVATFLIAKAIGEAASRKITEYQTTTRTVDLDTGAVIGEPIITWESKETTYVATIMVCEPWQKKPIGVGYIQNITAYDYIVPENIPEDYHLTAEDLLTGDLVQKYVYSELKDTLDPGDNTTDVTVLVTETFQDKNANRPSTVFVIPACIFGAIAGLGIDILLILIGAYGYEETKNKLAKLKDESERCKLSNQEIKERLSKMKDEAIELKSEYNDVVRNFGISKDEPMMIEIDPSWLQQSAMKRTRKNKPSKKTNR